MPAATAASSWASETPSASSSSLLGSLSGGGGLTGGSGVGAALGSQSGGAVGVVSSPLAASDTAPGLPGLLVGSTSVSGAFCGRLPGLVTAVVLLPRPSEIVASAVGSSEPVATTL